MSTQFASDIHAFVGWLIAMLVGGMIGVMLVSIPLLVVKLAIGAYRHFENRDAKPVIRSSGRHISV